MPIHFGPAIPPLLIHLAIHVDILVHVHKYISLDKNNNNSAIIYGSVTKYWNGTLLGAGHQSESAIDPLLSIDWQRNLAKNPFNDSWTVQPKS